MNIVQMKHFQLNKSALTNFVQLKNIEKNASTGSQPHLWEITLTLTGRTWLEKDGLDASLSTKNEDLCKEP